MKISSINNQTSFSAVYIKPAPEKWNKNLLESVVNSKMISKIIKNDADRGSDTIITLTSENDKKISKNDTLLRVVGDFRYLVFRSISKSSKESFENIGNKIKAMDLNAEGTIAVQKQNNEKHSKLTLEDILSILNNKAKKIIVDN